QNVTMSDIKRKNEYYNYLQENEVKYNINPYTNTGEFSVSVLFKNNIIIFIFVIFTFISMDLFLSEVEEGSYKLTYTQPYERRKSFFSKIIAQISFILLILLILLSGNFLINAVINGVGDFRYPIAIGANISKVLPSN